MRNDQERSSIHVDSSSSSGSSGKGQTEVPVKKCEEKNVVDLKQQEVIKKQVAERKKSAGAKSSDKSATKQKGVDDSAKKSAENCERVAVNEEKRPLPSAVKPRTPRTEV